MELAPYLSFDGRCEEAFTFYAATLGGKITGIFKFAGSPMEAEVPADWQGKVMHATLVLEGGTIMGADPGPQHYEAPKGFSLSVNTEKVEEAERIFNALAKDGKVMMPLQETFWALRFGVVTDRSVSRGWSTAGIRRRPAERRDVTSSGGFRQRRNRLQRGPQ